MNIVLYMKKYNCYSPYKIEYILIVNISQYEDEHMRYIKELLNGRWEYKGKDKSNSHSRGLGYSASSAIVQQEKYYKGM